MKDVYPSECIRPKTLGEMLRALKSGTPCEVLESFAPTAKMAFEGWLGFTSFTILGPPNDGWVCFVLNDDNATAQRSFGDGDGCREGSV